jgi:hypothetical protein
LRLPRHPSDAEIRSISEEGFHKNVPKIVRLVGILPLKIQVVALNRKNIKIEIPYVNTKGF